MCVENHSGAVGFGGGVVLKTPGDTLRNALCCRGAGCVRLGWGLTSPSEWGLMKTNDLTGSKGGDQG